MKNFLIKCGMFFIIIVLLFVPFSVITDPYNVFHADCPVDNGVEPNKNYIKTRRIIRNLDRCDSLVFGSSRVEFLDTALMKDGNYYNMAASEAVPAEHLENLKSLLQAGFRPKSILIGVDDISYFVDGTFHTNILYRKLFPWRGTLMEKFGFYLRYLDPITVIESLEVINDHEVNDPDWSDRLMATGTQKLNIPSQFDIANEKPYWSDYYSPREAVFDELQEISDICKEYDIRLTVFTNPIYGYTYMQAIENGYLDFLKGLAEVTDYYNFSGFNDYTLDNRYYYENSHYTPVVGNAMLSTIFEGKTDDRLLSEGFGVYVTKENVSDLLQILEYQAVNYGIQVNTYKDTLNRDKYQNEEN